MAKTVADLLIERLVEWGVDTLFGFPGDGINGIFESLRTHKDKIRFIQVRHEGPAVVEAVVDPNEPLMPGHATMDQAWKFAESLVRGEKDRWAIFKNVLKQQVREVV
jgi:thiamine pyrophosphate-dependent acetolactate synthase large subunit-like protein